MATAPGGGRRRSSRGGGVLLEGGVKNEILMRVPPLRRLSTLELRRMGNAAVGQPAPPKGSSSGRRRRRVAEGGRAKEEEIVLWMEPVVWKEGGCEPSPAPLPPPLSAGSPHLLHSLTVRTTPSSPHVAAVYYTAVVRSESLLLTVIGGQEVMGAALRGFFPSARVASAVRVWTFEEVKAVDRR